jgi:putative ABC transport system substrate-binding protein
MRRREAITLLGGAVAVGVAGVLTSQAQQSAALIGFLNAGSGARLQPELDAFRSGLRDLGYIEGRNIALGFRFADGQLDRLPALAAEMVRLDPAVIVPAPVPANQAIAKATSTIPIVMASGADPVGFGLVKSLAQPGGNITGLTNFAEELASKQIDLIRELLPRATRLAVLLNVMNPLHVPQWRETQAAAANVAIELKPFEFHRVDQFADAFAQFGREQVDALLVPPDVTFTTHRQRIASLALASHLPTIFFVRQSALDGGLISYGPNPVENYRRAATYVDKILKGAKPQDLPIERPTHFELVINLKTAKALGLEVPAVLLARADEVIE